MNNTIQWITSVTAIAGFGMGIWTHLKKYILPPKLKLSFNSKIWLTHTIGDPRISLGLTIKNVGAREILIKSIKAKLASNVEKKVFKLDEFTDDLESKELILFREFTLEPNEEWSHTLIFQNYFEEDDLAIYKPAYRELKNIIDRKRKSSDHTFSAHQDLRVEDKLIEPFRVLFKKYFIWKEGKYNLEIFIKTDIKKADENQKFSFSVSKALEKDFLEDVERFKSGDRILEDLDEESGEYIKLSKEKNP